MKDVCKSFKDVFAPLKDVFKLLRGIFAPGKDVFQSSVDVIMRMKDVCRSLIDVSAPMKDVFKGSPCREDVLAHRFGDWPKNLRSDQSSEYAQPTRLNHFPIAFKI
jgi:hypothetical protein